MTDPASPFGYDVYVLDDMDPSGRCASDEELAIAAMFHRLTVDQIWMIGAPTGDDTPVPFGFDVRQLVGEATTQARLEARAPEIALAVENDPRFAEGRTTVTLSLTAEHDTYDIAVAVDAFLTDQRPVRGVFGVSALTVAILAELP